jgi:predicted methyltransferase
MSSRPTLITGLGPLRGRLALLLLPLSVSALASCASGKGAQSGTPATGAAPAAATAPAAPAIDDATGQKLRAALAGGHRSEKNRARDVHRHPFETLSFFGLRDDMTVVELWPGGGWYTEVLAPVLKDRGKLVVTNFDPNGPADAYYTKRAKEMNALLAKDPTIFGKVEQAPIDPPAKLVLGAPGSADLVVTFRSVHGWMSDNMADKVFAASYDVLKPGGVLGVVDHRGKPGLDPKSGYVQESDVIRLAESVGFKLADKSEINANPKDTKDHPQGVWALPPSYAHGDKDREKYAAIGESDRMTLKFVKPGK